MHENEILVLLLASCVLGFTLVYRKQLHILPAYKLLLAAFVSAWLAWVATVVEHLAWPELFNVLEHLGYCLNGLLLLAWCWLGMRNDKVLQHD